VQSQWTIPPLLAIGLCLGGSARVQGQALGASLPSWSWDGVLLDAPESAQRYFTPTSGPWRSDTLSTHSHTGTGLLIGGLVGGVATAVFLAGFCSDADTECGADEIGRAVLFIAVPTALVGTLIGSLIRTKR
jgi:hypothetical protein